MTETESGVLERHTERIRNESDLHFARVSAINMPLGGFTWASLLLV
jgi:hypothetical protein